ncbi:CopG family transcriptional regulator [Planctomycetota bacterium]
MIRTQVLLTDEQRRMLDEIATERSISMGAVVREALEAYLKNLATGHRKGCLRRSHGAWAADDDREGRMLVRRLRAEWHNQGDEAR